MSDTEWLWNRLRWDDGDWCDQTRAVLDETIDALVTTSAGEELQTIAGLVDLIDEDIYSDGYNTVTLPPDASTTAVAASRVLQDGTPADALRAAIATSTTMEEVIRGLAEILLAWNDAYTSVND
jgi:hypothetical protein